MQEGAVMQTGLCGSNELNVNFSVIYSGILHFWAYWTLVHMLPYASYKSSIHSSEGQVLSAIIFSPSSFLSYRVHGQNKHFTYLVFCETVKNGTTSEQASRSMGSISKH